MFEASLQPQLQALNEIDNMYYQRLEWIARYKKKRHEEQMIKHAEALKNKL